MKKTISILLLFALVAFAACKKSEEQKAAEGTKGQKQVQPAGGNFKPQQPKPAVLNDKPLQVFNGSNLVATVQPAEYPAVTNTKINMGRKELNAILLKDFLAKYNLKGQKVVVSGEVIALPLTWDQATKNDIYIYITPKKYLKLYTTSKALDKLKLPKRVQKITVS